jgi:predicted nucleic acid-binding protein
LQKKIKIYLDTSIINFLFADDAPEKKEVTIDFFENYLKEYEVFISSIVISEIDKTSNVEKKAKLNEAISYYNLEIYNVVNNDILELANKYIENKIIPPSKLDDAQHVAFAVYYRFDILLSWNFKHLANINKQNLINGVNLLIGYHHPILLFNPMEVIYDKT